jgi:hypothetical protein
VQRKPGGRTQRYATYTKDCGIHNGKNASDTSFNAAQVGIVAVQAHCHRRTLVQVQGRL